MLWCCGQAPHCKYSVLLSLPVAACSAFADLCWCEHVGLESPPLGVAAQVAISLQEHTQHLLTEGKGGRAGCLGVHLKDTSMQVAW